MTTLLIDGNAVAYTINLSLCKNENDFIRMYLSHIREYAKQFTSMPKAILFFDDKKDNWRERLYPDYQKGRKEAKNKYTEIQLEEAKRRSEYLTCLKEKINKSRYTYLHYPHTETDDLISLYCNNIQKENETVIILTTDKDLFQLIREKGNKKVQVLFLIKRKLIKDEKLGQQILEEKIWLGDNSDSIPGVCKNVGKANFEDLKKFLFALEEYETKLDDKVDISDKSVCKKIAESIEVRYIPSFSNFDNEQLQVNQKLVNLSYVVELDEKENNVKTNYLKENVEKAKFSPFGFYSISR